MKRECSLSFTSIIRAHSSAEICCKRHSKEKCIEPKQKYKCNYLQKYWKYSLLPNFWGPQKLGALGLSLFSLMVNPRLSPSHLITCYYDTITWLKQLRCFIIKIPNNCKQLDVLCQARNQLGTPGKTKSFLRVAQIC